MKKIHIKNYQVMINKEKSSCGIAINIEHYKKLKIMSHDLKYHVLYDENKIKIINSDIEIVLHNCDKEFMYYAVKSIYLAIILGKPNVIIQQFVAEIN